MHRGITSKYTENTINALENSLLDERYNGFETDIMLTKDQKWIIFHDNDLNRFFNINKKIKDLNYNELPLLDGKKIPLLLNVLTFKKSNKIFNIEIKEDFDISDSSKNILKNIFNKIGNPLLVSSFNWKWYSWCNENKFNFAHLIETIDLPKNGKIFILDYKLLNDESFKNKLINYRKNKKLVIGAYSFNELKDVNFKYDIEIWNA